MKLTFCLFLLFSLSLPASALEILAPEVPRSGAEFMPESTASFADALLELLQSILWNIQPDISDAVRISTEILAVSMMLALLHTLSGRIQALTDLTGAAVISVILLSSANAMIQLGSKTIQELSDYGKLLYPVMAAGVAAQGGMTASTGLYIGTTIFDAFLSSFLAKLLLPLVYLFLATAAAASAAGEELLKKICTLIKSFLIWCLKTVLMIFTTYMSITGVVSGATDAAALKATKVTISTVVPVVGGILSDASEAVLVSAGLMKSAAGVYGILAALAVFLHPFARIGIHYLLLKATAALCSLIGTKRITGLVEDFSSAMGLLLAMTGAQCIILLVSTFCFMKGIQ